MPRLHHGLRPSRTPSPPGSPPPPPPPPPPASLSANASAAPTATLPDKRPRRVELIVKLGGAAITDKTTPHTLHPRNFGLAMDLIANLYNLSLGFILVHGAGSFGHFEASTHNLAAGSATPLGVSLTHAAVSVLNLHVVNALLRRGVPAVGVAPLLVPLRVRNDFVAALLDRGHLPVLHGDACYAGDGRTAVLSADALVTGLASAFSFVDRVVFLTDVPGLLLKPPSTCQSPPASNPLVPTVLVDEQGTLRFDLPQHQHVRTSPLLPHDVTGGMAAKLLAAARCVADTVGRVTAFIAAVDSPAAKALVVARPDRWPAVQCTRISYQVADAAAATSTSTKPTEPLVPSPQPLTTPEPSSTSPTPDPTSPVPIVPPASFTHHHQLDHPHTHPPPDPRHKGRVPSNERTGRRRSWFP